MIDFLIFFAHNMNMKIKKNSWWNYLLAVILSVMLIMPSFFENVSHTPIQAALNLSGSGTESNPYKITSTADLTNLANWVNSGNQCSGQYFELTENIDASGVPVIGTLKNNTTYYFKGIFDGNGKSIKNLNRSNSSNNNGDLGLFGYLQGTVKNLIILSGTINLSVNGKSAGAIAGSTYSGSLIENCFNSGCNINASNNNMGAAQLGGIVGAAGGNTTIRYCANYATITNNSILARSGGIMGIQNEGATTIRECFNKGNITAGTTKSTQSYAGGIIGQNGTISNCFNTGNITAKAKTNTENSTPAINKYNYCEGVSLKVENYSMKKVYNLAYCGGIVGYGEGSIKNSFNTGTITGGKSTISITSLAVFDAIINRTSGIVGSTTTGYQELTTNLSFDETIYFSGINGNINKSSTNCYSTTSNLSNTVNYSVKEHVYSQKVLGGTTEIHNKALAEKSDAAYTVNQNLSLYNLENLDATVSNTKLTLICSSSSASLKVSTDLTWTTGMLWWEKKHNQTLSCSIFSITINRKQNYSIKSLSSMKSSSFASTLGSSYWAYNSLLNDSLPYLKKIFWASNASNSYD